MNKNYILLALIILGFNLDACKKETNNPVIAIPSSKVGSIFVVSTPAAAQSYS